MEKSTPVAFVMELPEGAESVPATLKSETPVVVLLLLDSEFNTRFTETSVRFSAGPPTADNTEIFGLTTMRVPDVPV